MAQVITEDHAAYSTVDEPASAEIAAFVEEDDGTPLKPPPPSGDTFTKHVQKQPKKQLKGGPVAGTGSGAKANPSPAAASKSSSVRIPIELSKAVQEVEERSESSSYELVESQ